MTTFKKLAAAKWYLGIVLTIALLNAVPSAHAVQIQVDANSILGSVIQGPYSDGPANSGFVQVFETDNNGSNASYIHTYADVDGVSGSRISGTGVSFNANGQASYSTGNITNTTSTAQDFNFSFTLNAGEVSISPIMNPMADMAAGDVLSAGFSMEIFASIDGGPLNTVWATGYEIIQDNSTASPAATQTGANIGGSLSADGSSYIWSAFTETVNIGVVNQGSSLTIEYLLTSFANGSLLGTVGNTPCVIASNCLAIGRVGEPIDPNDLDPARSGAPIVVTSTPTDPVDTVALPGTLALLACGFLGVGLSRKSREIG